jgi:hypothetical protein
LASAAWRAKLWIVRRFLALLPNDMAPCKEPSATDSNAPRPSRPVSTAGPARRGRRTEPGKSPSAGSRAPSESAEAEAGAAINGRHAQETEARRRKRTWPAGRRSANLGEKLGAHLLHPRWAWRGAVWGAAYLSKPASVSDQRNGLWTRTRRRAKQVHRLCRRWGPTSSSSVCPPSATALQCNGRTSGLESARGGLRRVSKGPIVVRGVMPGTSVLRHSCLGYPAERYSLRKRDIGTRWCNCRESPAHVVTQAAKSAEDTDVARSAR